MNNNSEWKLKEKRRQKLIGSSNKLENRIKFCEAFHATNRTESDMSIAHVKVSSRSYPQVL